MLTLLAALGCTDPAPTPTPEPELPSSVQEDPLPSLPEATPAVPLGAAIDLPWPAEPPCAQFARVQVSGAFLERPDGSLLTTEGHQRARFVDPEDFVAGLVIRPDLDPVHIDANCADPREKLVWSCTADSGCTLEQQRIGGPPELPRVLASLDRPSLAKATPTAAQAKDLAPVVRAAVAHSIALLEDCQDKGCQSAPLLSALESWRGPLPEPEILDGPPWKLIYVQGEDAAQRELHFSCQSSVCTLRLVGGAGMRLDLRAGTQSLYVMPGRLDYRDEGLGPRVAYSGRLVALKTPPAE